ncbi:MAG: hypothetical protein F4162_01140 [Synechococcus sp. SB0676_bin_10]|uniref:Uncharacterized protein n=1 Tax=Synechococcus sp. SB0676_bin_10 TaxID=2604869 RepID=A0A6B1F9M1_9SYNE|nr:hypothetical protein [Cyanobacteria bacterium MAG IRC3_bin_20]MDE0648704.1 hypothetical protein [Cyanobacteria bacterium MAG IRC4_bin_6]MXY18874.1 hypothetical protein [Synechococcus sp. SB0664_bin_36]MYG37633.1 hypothetical protein [Synechococcus sp. SB0676_bin_10]MYG63722.1 hypothetical protein [Synechococcus sp. SB0675_bin_7]MYK06580.1 hypothetical protein [Synechococcus sp. SB0670_bin_20]MYK85273.1 hypothetical protein [Synechococcus sp. SB0669_bin_7]
MTDNFDKLIKNYDKRPEVVRKKEATSRVHWRFTWFFLGSLVLTVFTGFWPGGMILLSVLSAWGWYASREWMG